MFLTKDDVTLIRNDIDGTTMTPSLLYVIEMLLDGETIDAEDAEILRDLAIYARIKYYVAE